MAEPCYVCQLLAEHQPCCSSHDKPLCCEDYRRFHFVEIRPCCATDRVRLAAEQEADHD